MIVSKAPLKIDGKRFDTCIERYTNGNLYLMQRNAHGKYEVVELNNKHQDDLKHFFKTGKGCEPVKEPSYVC